MALKHMDVREQVGRNLRRFRKRAGLSQEELAYQAEINRGYVNGIERFVRNPTVLILQRLAVPLGVRPADFLLDAQNADEVPEAEAEARRKEGS